MKLTPAEVNFHDTVRNLVKTPRESDFIIRDYNHHFYFEDFLMEIRRPHNIIQTIYKFQIYERAIWTDMYRAQVHSDNSINWEMVPSQYTLHETGMASKIIDAYLNWLIMKE